MGRCSFFTRIIFVSVVAFAGGVGCQLYERNVPSASTAPVLPGQSTGVFTTARPSFGAALNNFMDRRPTPVQPIEFPHNIHVGKQIACTEYCHEAVTSGPVAGLPSVKTCMICHESIATDRPLIKTVADYASRGIDLSWQRVYGYAGEAHVRFNHAPHIRAKVECSTCHGDIAQQTVAQRNVEMNMGFCVDCHKRRQAPNECLTCHF